MKAILVRRWVSLREVSASVLIDKLAFAVGQAVFLGFGLAPLFQSVVRGPTERVTRSRSSPSGSAVCWRSSRCNDTGSSAAVRRLFGPIRPPSRRGSPQARSGTRRTHFRIPSRSAAGRRHVRSRARGRPSDPRRTVLARTPRPRLRAGVVECFTLATGFVFVEATLFLVPAKLGVLEGGNLLAFTMLGYDASTGLAVAFVMRISDLVALLPGLAAFARYSLRYANLRDHSGLREVA